MRMAKRETKRRKTAFVPRVVFATAIVGTGVIPACVTACGGKITGNNVANVAAIAFPGDAAMATDGSGDDGVATIGFGGVANTGFPGGDVAIGFGSVAVSVFGGGDVAVDGFGGVVDVGFRGGEVAEAAFGGVADAGFIAPDASDATEAD
jgi:hypothetical protein